MADTNKSNRQLIEHCDRYAEFVAQLSFYTDACCALIASDDVIDANTIRGMELQSQAIKQTAQQLSRELNAIQLKSGRL